MVAQEFKDVRLHLGENIRKARKEKEWSQEELAIRADIHSNYLSTIELGQQNISIETLVKIAYALEVPVSVLVEGV